ncbi:MAG: pyruvate dehydrogenase (acetyl-transferring) E1 component subunit alpha [Acidobacteriota bacterium]|nr:pyruvate dehydrogenase (acetyl-transferring) E1 component subunit alpha [Acidobacteriota bacterium]MDQ7088895.1 pyruvate dehydrogenase (acetyl-transferring) E1 component subunit alpha [Acidobacteriota bacterium]
MPAKQTYKFTIPYLRILDQKGVVNTKLDPGLSDERLVALYRHMVLAREADQRMLRLQRQGRLGTFSPSTGQEAAACGPAMAMEDSDWLVPAFRELGALLMRGVPLHRVLLFWGGFEEGNIFPGVKRTLPIAVIVASQIPHAAGVAYAMKYKSEKSAVLCFFGDGATSEGDFHEGLNFAAVWKAPVVFICQNNQWAISTPIQRQMHSETVAQKAVAYGIPGVRVDGNDPLAMYAATREALERARAGEGPTLIEALTYRLMMHTTADDPSKYRDDEEVQTWQDRDPLRRMRRLLDRRKLWSESEEESLLAQVKQQIDAEVKVYEQGVRAKPDILFDHVWAESYPEIEEQRAAFLARQGEGDSNA